MDEVQLIDYMKQLKSKYDAVAREIVGDQWNWPDILSPIKMDQVCMLGKNNTHRRKWVSSLKAKWEVPDWQKASDNDERGYFLLFTNIIHCFW